MQCRTRQNSEVRGKVPRWSFWRWLLEKSIPSTVKIVIQRGMAAMFAPQACLSGCPPIASSSYRKSLSIFVQDLIRNNKRKCLTLGDDGSTSLLPSRCSTAQGMASDYPCPALASSCIVLFAGHKQLCRFLGTRLCLSNSLLTGCLF